jgi:hypothetical protein
MARRKRVCKRVCKRPKRSGKGRRRRGGNTEKVLGAIGSAGKIMNKLGIGQQVRKARTIVGKGALGVLKRRMSML